MHSSGTNKLLQVFQATSTTELAACYDDLAAEYDELHANSQGHLHIVEALARYVGPDARILDAGCGSGMTGQLLFERGYSQVEGVDLSDGMLAQARQKHCYRQLYQQVLGEPLTFATDSFDAVLGVGIFAKAHVPSTALHEFIRITRPGGYILFNIRPEFYQASDFQEVLPALEQDGRWQLVEAGPPLAVLPGQAPHILMQVWVYQVV